MSGELAQFFERYVRERSRQDHRFYVVSDAQCDGRRAHTSRLQMASMLKPSVEAFAEKVQESTDVGVQLGSALNDWARSQFNVCQFAATRIANANQGQRHATRSERTRSATECS